MAGPREMRSVVIDAQIKRTLAVGVDVAERIISDDVGKIARRSDRFAITDNRGVPVFAGSPRDGEPMGQAMLRGETVAKVPFTAEAADIAGGSQDVGVAGLPFEIFLRIGRHAALGDPVMNAVLRGNAAGHQASAGWGADR